MAFRLEKLLYLRAKEEESLKSELSRIRTEIRKVEEEIDNVENSKKQIEMQLRTGTQTGTQVAFFIYLIKMYNEHIGNLRLKLSELRLLEEKTLQMYLEKRTERRSFEKLKERYIRSQMIENDRKERIVIDEVALQKYIRNTSGT
ncbi:flagellar export protein FliJ [Fervidobacterium gondwanense]|uniref:Flagellar FliJ protein n=1 Tax=Fervidobacterium gondwanense DSM 13020 TaxID=1121883 RepID=A0A1M7SUR2_FERGO|nr:flagellar export protein FliJ [Fervidobacterium gondwanense]SHN62225.1 flagellar FliJ protein [Fervidobacterium gondwanense DSM 13020]